MCITVRVMGALSDAAAMVPDIDAGYTRNESASPRKLHRETHIDADQLDPEKLPTTPSTI